MPGLGKVLSTGTAKTFSLGRFIRKNLYWVVLIFVIIPIVLTSFHTAKEMNNYWYIPLALGNHMINADSLLTKDINILKTNPAELIGVEKPTTGVYHRFVYWWHVAKVGWLIFGLLWLLLLPFMFLYRIVFNPLDDSKKWRNILLTAFWGSLFIFIVNLVNAVYVQSQGTILYNFPATQNQFVSLAFILVNNLPFHGVVALVQYLITLI